MARTEGDSWDLATSVGATMVAADQAAATRSAEPLINDPFAEPLSLSWNAVSPDGHRSGARPSRR
jgi:O-methyltransferase involved in polyketide biosynthesis